MDSRTRSLLPERSDIDNRLAQEITLECGGLTPLCNLLGARLQNEKAPSSRRTPRVFRYQGKQNRVMRHAINRQALTHDAFTDGAGPFSDALAGDVIDSGDNFYAV